jgi:hypothetical protein
MSTKHLPTYSEVLTAVTAWPPERRFELIHDVLRTLAPKPSVSKEERQAALRRLRGMLATSDPPPTDEEIERLLDERRMRKLG